VILFLNKADLFEKKVGKYLVREHFKDFDGEETAEAIIDFFKEKFTEQKRGKRGSKARDTEIHFHVTCATDTRCVRRMFESCRTIIIKKELEIQGFL